MADTQSLDHRELERKSQDRIRVFNPTPQDYAVIWDGYKHLVPAQGEAVFPRYIATKFIREMTDKILTERQDQAVAEENDKRRTEGKQEMDKWQGAEQNVFEDKFRFAKGVSNPEARKQVMQTLWGGVVEEYGLGMPAEAVKPPATNSDLDLLAEIEQGGFAGETDNGKAPIESLTDKNVFELQKMAREKGVEFDKTDKKDELIAKISQ